jgi:hypothetical protein
MRVSIALCTYNGETYLQEQLESLRNQSHSPIELVVCDDKSDDHTYSILERFTRSAPFPVRLYSNAMRMGTYKNFEKAAALCRGEIVVYCDQDDVWRQDKLSVVAATFANKPHVGAVITDAELVDENLKIIHRSLWRTLGFHGVRRRRFVEISPFEALPSMVPAHGVIMGFRTAFRPILFPLPDGAPHDVWTAIIVALCGQIELVPAPLIKYRQHPGQQSGVRALAFGSRLAREAAVTQRILQDDAELLTAARHRVAYSRAANAESLYVLDLKIAHLNSRLRMHGSKRVEKLIHTIRELSSGNYHKYSNGFMSAGRDLLWQ